MGDRLGTPERQTNYSLDKSVSQNRTLIVEKGGLELGEGRIGDCSQKEVRSVEYIVLNLAVVKQR